MSQIQDLIRHLTAAGSAEDPDGNGEFLLNVSADSSLHCQLWSNNSVVQEELITRSVRPNSTAAYFITPTDKLIISITTSSTLSAYTYDDDEEEWSKSDKYAGIAKYSAHPNGKVAGAVDNGRIRVVFQDPSQHLTCLEFHDDAWTSTVLPGDPVISTPISAMAFEDGLQVFYLSANDNRIHSIAQENGVWNDAIDMQLAFSEEIKAFSLVPGQAGENESYVLTRANALMKVTEGGMVRLGVVKNGEYVPDTTEEASLTVRQYYRNGQVKNEYEYRDMRSRDIPHYGRRRTTWR